MPDVHVIELIVQAPASPQVIEVAVPGQQGPSGPVTVAVGTTTTLSAGSNATVVNGGTSGNLVLNFGIPKGDTGNPGADGEDGQDGAAATIAVGTVTTVSSASPATVTNVGTSSAAVFNFEIPRGADGDGSGDMLAATLRGDVDGFAWTSQASKLALDAAPDKIFEMTQDGLEKFFVSHQLLLVNDGALQAQPELGDRAVRALLAAEDYMAKNASWPDIVAPRVRAEADFDVRLVPVSIFVGRAPQRESGWFSVLFSENWVVVGRFRRLLPPCSSGPTCGTAP